MLVDEQIETIQFLERLLGERSPVEVMTTHASMILLTEDRAYKLKRAVRFPYLDYSTAQQRHTACQAELSLNRRTAPEIYIGVHTITREADGQLALDGAGPLIDALVEMHRFDQECLLDRMAQQGSLTSTIMADLAHRIAVFHHDAAISLEHGGVKGIAGVLEINERSLRATGLVPDDVATTFSKNFRQALEHHSDVLERRRLSGKVRRCHGDLILRNICLWHGTPTLFDCLEFDENLATIDVLYDLAFLLMDLWHRNQQQLANTLLNRYLDEADETDGLGLIPFFMAIRAAVRAHVTAAQAEHASLDTVTGLLSEARQYFDLAESLLKPARACPCRHRRVERDRQVDHRLSCGTLFRAGSRSPHPEQRSHPKTAAWSARPMRGCRRVPIDRRFPSRSMPSCDRRLNERCTWVPLSLSMPSLTGPRSARSLSSLLLGAAFPSRATGSRPRWRCWCLGWRPARKDPSDATADVVRMQAERDYGKIDWVRLDASQEPAIIKDDILQRQGIGRTASLSQDNLKPPEAMKPS